MRNLLYALLLVLAVFFVLTHISHIEVVLETLHRGRSRWLLVAAILELAWLIIQAMLYRTVYRLLGLRIPLSRMIPLSAAAHFSNVLAPSVGNLAMYVDDARKHNLSTGRVTLATLLTVWVEYIAFIAVLALGFVVLFRRNSIELPEVVASSILIGIAVAFGILLILGMRSAHRLESVLVWIARNINRLVALFINHDYLSEALAHRFAQDTAQAFHRLRHGIKSLWLPFALALIAKTLHIIIFMLIFLAFQQPFSLGTLIAGYSLANLFTIVSVTPGGLAIVEGVMVVALRTLRVPLASATVITLAWRGFTFWMPFGLGFIALRLKSKAAREQSAGRWPSVST